MRILLGVLALCGSSLAFAGDWPQFRGPARDGRLAKLEHPMTWSQDENLAWSVEVPGGGMASPVAGGGYYYLTRSGGILACHETATGKEVYRERLAGAATIAASMWLADNRLFILDEAGKTFVVEAGAQYKLLGTNTLSDTFWSTPAAAGPTLLLRGVDRLYCVKK